MKYPCCKKIELERIGAIYFDNPQTQGISFYKCRMCNQIWLIAYRSGIVFENPTREHYMFGDDASSFMTLMTLREEEFSQVENAFEESERKGPSEPPAIIELSVKDRTLISCYWKGYDSDVPDNPQVLKPIHLDSDGFNRIGSLEIDEYLNNSYDSDEEEDIDNSTDPRPEIPEDFRGIIHLVPRKGNNNIS
jgi:hypothetical protein